MTTKRKKRVYKKLPPHSNEPFPITTAGEVNKQFVITIISVVAIIALSMLLFFSDRFVGKAISFTTPQINDAGFFIDSNSNTIEVGEIFTLPVQVNLGGKNSSMVSFELIYDDTALTADCSYLFNSLDTIFPSNLVLIKESYCQNGKVNLTFAALPSPSKFITGEKTIAEINFTANTLGETSLNFTFIDVYDLANSGLIPLTVQNATIEVVQPPQCINPNSGLISWWSGNGTEDKTGKNAITKVGGNTQFVNGKIGKAFSLDGNGDYLEIENNPSLNPSSITIGSWINPTVTNTFQRIVSKGTVVDLYMTDSGLLRGGIVRKGEYSTPIPGKNVPITSNQWSYVALTYDELTGMGKIYLNGVEVGGIDLKDNVPLSSSPINFNIGRSSNGNYFQGLIDEVEIYNESLSAQEVKSIFDAGSVGKCELDEKCGDGIKGSSEQCDDGNNVNGDNCSSSCLIEINVCNAFIASCTQDQQLLQYCNDWGTGYKSIVNCSTLGQSCINGKCDWVCGDGIKGSSEGCDDDNTNDGDGCSSSCIVEQGYTCSGTPSSCSLMPPCIDLDGDGSNNQICGGDCDDNNSNINPSATEVCNNVDDNCNNQVDESITQLCSTGLLGVCSVGTQTCKAGLYEQCTQNVQPSTDVCDGLDNDCDNTKDEDFTSQPTTCGKGVCASTGTTSCSNGKETNSCTPKSPTETLETSCKDNLDNDCDGLTDNIDPDCGAVLGITVEGSGINLTDADGNNFTTIVTATVNLTNTPLTIVTVLYDKDDKVLYLKTQQITGLNKGETQVEIVDYSKTEVKRKRVIVYDKEENPGVYAQMIIDY